MEKLKIRESIVQIEGIPASLTPKAYFELIDVIMELCDDERILTEAKVNAIYPTKKAKEIALEAAIRNKPNYMPSINQNTLAGAPIYDLLREAEKIYQWLIKE